MDTTFSQRIHDLLETDRAGRVEVVDTVIREPKRRGGQT